MLRTKDLHAGALSTVPPDVDDSGEGEVRSGGSPDAAVGAPA
ncbi:hypothetical protein ACH4S8_32795 [Streptomyces sp. NPDC021080]